MKKPMLTSLLLGALMTGNAIAADLSVKAPIMKAPPMPTYSWTGCYLDAGFGYGLWNQDEFTNLPAAPTSATVTAGGRGWLGRFGGGCDLQLTGTFSSFVIGALGDYDAMSLKGTNALPDAIGGGLFAAPGAADETESSAWAVGARIGYLPSPNLLSYVNGGYTQTRFDQQNLFNVVIGGAPINVSLPAQTFNGWFIGGGTEYAVPWTGFNGLFWRTEYRYSQYSSANLGFFVSTTGVPTGLFENEKKFVQTVTTSLVWRFNFFH